MPKGSRWIASARAAALATVFLSTAATVHAQPSGADRDTAKHLMDQGRERLEQKNFKGALEAFKAADDLMHVPSTAFQVGNAQAELGLLVEARETFARVMRSQQQANEPVPFKRAREAAAALYEELEGRIPALRLDVRGATGDASLTSLTVDEVPVSPAARKLPFKLNPGHHVVIAKMGTATAKEEVDVREHETKDVVLTLPAQISTTPAPPVEAPATRGLSTLTYVGFGTAAVGIVVGTYTGILMFSKKSKLDEECSADKQCPSNGDLSAAYTMATISTVSFVVAAVGVGVGIYGLMTGRAPARAYAIGPGGLRGSF